MKRYHQRLFACMLAGFIFVALSAEQVAATGSNAAAEELHDEDAQKQRNQSPKTCPPSLVQKMTEAHAEAPDHLQVVLFASHHGLVGATVDEYSEEIWAKEMVPRAVELLREKGYRNIVLAGMVGEGEASENEYGVSLLCFNDYTNRVIITSHLNSGAPNVGEPAMLIYGDASPYVWELNNHFSKALLEGGVYYSGKVYDPEYRILTPGGPSDWSERYLLEWANIQDVNELAWARNTTARAQELAHIVEATFGSRMYNVNDPAAQEKERLTFASQLWQVKPLLVVLLLSIGTISVLRKKRTRRTMRRVISKLWRRLKRRLPSKRTRNSNERSAHGNTSS